MLHAPVIDHGGGRRDADRELARLQGAISGMHRQIDRCWRTPRMTAPMKAGTSGGLSDGRGDRGWIGKMQEAVESGITAEAPSSGSGMRRELALLKFRMLTSRSG